MSKVLKKTSEVKVAKNKHAREFKDFIYSQKYPIAFDYYTNPKSGTFDNAYKSAIKAGFPETSATTITVTKWWKNEMALLEEELPTARENIKQILTMNVNQEIRDRDTGEVIASVLDPKLLKIKADVSMFVAETIGKKKYSKKIEIESVEPESIEVNADLKRLFGYTVK